VASLLMLMALLTLLAKTVLEKKVPASIQGASAVKPKLARKP
jgi:ABC-type sulfate transport system permease subunit